MVVITIIIETMYEAIFRHFKAIPIYMSFHMDSLFKMPVDALK